MLICRPFFSLGLVGTLLFSPSFVGSQNFQPQVPVPSASILYSSGQRDLIGGKHNLARKEFQDFVKYYGDSQLASNAQFYLAEIAYSQQDYQNAVIQYRLVLSNYPKSSHFIAAHFKKGLSLIECGQRTAGVRELRNVIGRFPGTDEARRAGTKLAELGVIP